MLDNNDFYVVVKLTSGEQMMAVLLDEDEDHIIVDYPMCIRMIPILAENREHLTAYPLCQFAEDTSFILDKKNVLFVKKLHHVFVPHYQRIVEESNDMALVTRNKDGSVKRAEDLDWGDEEDYLTVDEARKRLDLLNSLLGNDSEKEEEDLRVFVEGNDTIN